MDADTSKRMDLFDSALFGDVLGRAKENLAFLKSVFPQAVNELGALERIVCVKNGRGLPGDAEEAIEHILQCLIPGFRHPLDDFPDSKIARNDSAAMTRTHAGLASLDLAVSLQRHYRLPSIPGGVDDSGPACSTLYRDENCVVVSLGDQLDSERIIDESARLYAIPAGLDRKSVIDRADAHNNAIFRDAFGSLCRRMFPARDRRSLMGRAEGLRQCLKHYFAMLKNHEPELYRCCHAAAKALGPCANKMLALSAVAVHQGERLFVDNFLASYGRQHTEDLRSFPLYVFLNGDCSSLLSSRIEELRDFAGSQSALPPKRRVALRVVVARHDQWRMGLKAVPAVVALMHLALAQPDCDADMALNIFDGDILKLEDGDNLQQKQTSVAAGCLLTRGYYQDDRDALITSNINYQLANDFYQYLKTLVIGRAALEKKGIAGKAENNARLRTSAANASFSAMFYCLLGGIRCYSHNEVLELTKVMSTQVSLAFACERARDACRMGIMSMPEHCRNMVTCDGGAIIRAMRNGVPLVEQFNSRSVEGAALRYALPPIDESAPTSVNHRRLRREVEFMIAKFIGFNIRLIAANTPYTTFEQWPPSIHEIYRQGIARFQDHINKTLSEVLQEGRGETYVRLTVDRLKPVVHVEAAGVSSLVSYPVYMAKYALTFYSV